MVAETVEAIPLQEAIPGTNGRRRGGRPPKLNPDGSRVNPPRPRDAKRRAGRRPSSRRATPRGPKSLAGELRASLTMLNTLVIMTPIGTRPAAAILDASVPVERLGYELDTAEINALADALDAQCRRSPAFRKWVERFLSAGSGGQLVTVLGIIAARRAARAGAIPNGRIVDLSLGAMLEGADLGALGNFAPSAAPDAPDMTTGETAPEPSGIDFDSIDAEAGAALGMEP